MVDKLLILHYDNRLEVYEDTRKMLDKVSSMANGKLTEYDRQFAAKLLEGDFHRLERVGDLGRYSFDVDCSVVLYRGYRGQ